MYNMDRLFDKVAANGHVCVGLDTAPDYIPLKERKAAASDAEAIFFYNKTLIDSTLDVAACYKVQIAYYEAMGLDGLKVYADTLRYLRQKKAIVIADIKRGDIADTAMQYAKAHFAGDFEADFVTLAPYMGMDSIEPWAEYAKTNGKGAFVLMRTSNKGMKDFEYQEVKSGGRLYNVVGNRLSQLAETCMGKSGYGAFGAVVGCTETEEAAEIRAKYGNLFFLIPGYGAQGGAANDAAILLRNGNGGVVNASRSILKAWTKIAALEEADFSHVANAGFQAAVEMRDAILQAVKS
jgi:orotidine-5'-phosphate decarboxylase